MSKKKNKKNKLKHCPFCGEKFVLRFISSEASASGYRFYLIHKDPLKARDKHCPLFSAYFDSEQEAIDAWNHRA